MVVFCFLGFFVVFFFFLSFQLSLEFGCMTEASED